MSGYLSSAQIEQLLKPINARRVGKDGKGFSHVEAYDIRAHLNRIFGFGRWSNEVTSCELVFEEFAERSKDSKKWLVWTVCYRAVVRVTVHSPDGTVLASYEDGATGEAVNQPGHGDAHDLALKTALSQALKRAAVNLGDQFGLSLYNKGSVNALVARTLVTPDTETPTGDEEAGESVDSHITEPLAAEDTAADEPRERNEQGFVDPAADLVAAAEAVRDTLQAVVAVPGAPGERARAIGDLMKQAQRTGCLGVKVDTEDGPVAVKVLLEGALRGSRAA